MIGGCHLRKARSRQTIGLFRGRSLDVPSEESSAASTGTLRRLELIIVFRVSRGRLMAAFLILQYQEVLFLSTTCRGNYTTRKSLPWIRQ